MMENVKPNRYIYKNYSAISCNVKDPIEGRHMGDNYYYWGALPGFYFVDRNGTVGHPVEPSK